MIWGEVARGINNLYGDLPPVQSIGINTDKSALRDNDFSIPLDDTAVGFESSSPRVGKLKREVGDLHYEADKAQREVDHFHGSKAFEVMKAMNKGEILNFLDLTKDDEDPEFPYIKEYRRFL